MTKVTFVGAVLIIAMAIVALIAIDALIERHSSDQKENGQ